jgi:hypothetical protein
LFLLLPRDEATDAANSTVSHCDTLTAIATGGRSYWRQDDFRRLVEEVVVTLVGLWAIHSTLQWMYAVGNPAGVKRSMVRFNRETGEENNPTEY